MVAEAEAKVSLVAIVARIGANEKKPVEQKLSRALAVTPARYVARASRAYLGEENGIEELHGTPSGLTRIRLARKPSFCQPWCSSEESRTFFLWRGT